MYGWHTPVFPMHWKTEAGDHEVKASPGLWKGCKNAMLSIID